MQEYAAWLECTVSTPWAFAAVACLAASSWLLGRLLLKNALGIDIRKPACELLLHFGMGLNIWSLLGLGLCWLGLLTPPLMKGLLLSAGALALALAATKLTAFDPAKGKAFLKANWPFLAVASFLFAFCLGNALCPPVGIGVDEQTYQLPVPARWIADRFPHVYADIPYSGYPSEPNFLFAAVMAAGKTSAPRLLCLFVHTLSFASLYFLLRGLLRPLWALALCMPLFFATAHLNYSSEVFAEPFVLLNFLCALTLLELLPNLRGSLFRQGLALGLFAGALAATKLTAFPVCAFLGIAALFVCKGSWKGRAALTLGALAGGLFAAPYYLRVLLETGNPFHPYLSWLFSSDPAVVESSRFFHVMGGLDFYGLPGFWNAVLAPLRICYAGKTYFGSWGWQFLFIFCLSLAAIAWALLKRPRKWQAIPLYGAGALFLFVCWLKTSQQARFLECSVALLVLCVASLLPKLPRKLALWLLGGILLATAISAPLPGWPKYYIANWKAQLSGVPVAQFIRGVWKIGLFDSFAILSQVSKPDDKVMLLFEKRTLHCPRPYVIGSPLYQAVYFTPPPQGADDEVDKAVLDGIARSGAKFILLRLNFDKEEALPSVHERIEPFWKSLERLVLSKRLATIWTGKNYALLKVPEEAEARR